MRQRLFTKENQEDVFQDTLDEFLRKPGLLPIAEPVAYLIGFAKNVIKRLVRYKVIGRGNLLNYARKMKAQENDEQISKTSDYDTCKESLKQLIKQLPPKQRDVMEQVLFHDKKLKDICEQFNYKSMNVFYSVISQNRSKLLEIIDNSPNHTTLKEFLRNNWKKNGKRRSQNKKS